MVGAGRDLCGPSSPTLLPNMKAWNALSLVIAVITEYVLLRTLKGLWQIHRYHTFRYTLLHPEVVWALPGFHGMDLGNIQSSFPTSGSQEPHSSHWCKAPISPAHLSCFHRYSPKTEGSHKQGCNLFYCSDVLKNSGEQRNGTPKKKKTNTQRKKERVLESSQTVFFHENIAGYNLWHMTTVP